MLELTCYERHEQWKSQMMDTGAEISFEGHRRWKMLQHQSNIYKHSKLGNSGSKFPCVSGQRQGVDESRWRRGM